MKKLLMIILTLAVLLCGCGRDEIVYPNPDREPAQTDASDAASTEAAPAPENTETVQRLVRTSVTDESGSEVWYREYAYDSRGRETEYWEYDSDGLLSTYSSTDYTSDTGYETSFESGEEEYTVRYTCDENGRILRQETEQDGAVTSLNEYTYDAYGNTLTTRMVYGEFETTITYEYTCDEAGRPLTSKEYQDGTLSGWTEMEYDDQGRETASSYYSFDGTLNHSTVTTWEGSTETRVSYDMEGSAYMTRIITRDDSGNTTRQETWQDGVMVSCTVYTYEAMEITAE